MDAYAQGGMRCWGHRSAGTVTRRRAGWSAKRVRCIVRNALRSGL